MRRYGASLDKFEPNDVNGALVPSQQFLASISAEKISGAMKTVKETGQLPQWAEDLFAPLTVPGNMTHRMTTPRSDTANSERGRHAWEYNQTLAGIMHGKATPPAQHR